MVTLKTISMHFSILMVPMWRVGQGALRFWGVFSWLVQLWTCFILISTTKKTVARERIAVRGARLGHRVVRCVPSVRLMGLALVDCIGGCCDGSFGIERFDIGMMRNHTDATGPLRFAIFDSSDGDSTGLDSDQRKFATSPEIEKTLGATESFPVYSVLVPKYSILQLRKGNETWEDGEPKS